MTFRDSAREAVLKAADTLSLLSSQIGIMRSVDATESAAWLKEVAQRLRDATREEPPAEEGPEWRTDRLFPLPSSAGEKK